MYVFRAPTWVSFLAILCSTISFMSNIFDLTTRPHPDLFLSQRDPNDPRLAELVSTDHNEYAAADIVILGCPQDEGVRRNNGRVGAADAPAAIRKEFYRLTPF